MMKQNGMMEKHIYTKPYRR